MMQNLPRAQTQMSVQGTVRSSVKDNPHIQRLGSRENHKLSTSLLVTRLQSDTGRWWWGWEGVER